MIAVQTIVNQIESALDATGFDYYQFDEDYKPAINYAQKWLMQLYTRVLADKKFSEEMVRELSYVRVWKTSIYGRVHFNTADIGGEIQSIIAVYPEPTVIGSENPPLIPLAGLGYITGYTYLSSYYAADKTNAEKVNDNRKNPFANGNEIVTGDLKSYSYTAFTNYNTLYTELEVQPSTGARQTVAIAYLLNPADITLITDNVKFPTALLPLIVDKSLEFISWKQGDRTNLNSVTDADVKKLTQLTT